MRIFKRRQLMARVIGTDPQGLSVRELIALLEKCPDKDAWVVLPESSDLDHYRHDPFRLLVGVRSTDSATVELVDDGGGYY
jgi:hypothetical protein